MGRQGNQNRTTARKTGRDQKAFTGKLDEVHFEAVAPKAAAVSAHFVRLPGLLNIPYRKFLRQWIPSAQFPVRQPKHPHKRQSNRQQAEHAAQEDADVAIMNFPNDHD
jgi:hypothetical protein